MLSLGGVFIIIAKSNRSRDLLVSASSLSKSRKMNVKIFSISCILAFFAISASQADSVDFESLGFSMSPPETVLSEMGQQPLMLFLPADDGFAPNVNVMIQPYAGTMEEYTELSLSQFRQLGLEVVEEPVIEESSGVFQYQGFMNGLNLRFYAKAFAKGDKIYLITATAKQSHWDKYGGVLIKSVESFQLSD